MKANVLIWKKSKKKSVSEHEYFSCVYKSFSRNYLLRVNVGVNININVDILSGAVTFEIESFYLWIKSYRTSFASLLT